MLSKTSCHTSIVIEVATQWEAAEPGMLNNLEQSILGDCIPRLCPKIQPASVILAYLPGKKCLTTHAEPLFVLAIWSVRSEDLKLECQK